MVNEKTMLSVNTPTEENDIFWMKHALSLADKAEAIGEVPVGACVVINGAVVSIAA